MSDVVQDLYRESTPEKATRASFQGQIEKAKNYYKDYLGFIQIHLPKGASYLDLGCGEAWSTLFLRELGYQAQGVDLKTAPVEAQSVDPDLPYSTGDAQNIPFPDETFDGVGLYQVLGHIPDPEKALNECIRVLKPGGRLIVVSPNLINFVNNLRFSLKHTARCLSEGKLWESRTPELPIHPGGNTMPESWKYSFLFLTWTLRKLAGERPPQFLMREPDIHPPFFANNDTCYYSNPMDLVNWARMHENLSVIRKQRHNNFLGKATWFIRGTWVVIEKSREAP